MPYANVNGLNLYYEDHGAGPALVLLHGGTDTIAYFADAITRLAPTFRLIAIEQMGHGRTADRPERAFHYHDMAMDTLGVMDYLGVGKASFLGFSDGAIIALDIAIHHPERVAKLALTGGNARLEGYDPVAREWIANLLPEDMPMPQVYATMSPDGPGHWPVVIARIRQLWMSEPDYSDAQLRSITAPALLITGDRDMVTVEHVTVLFRAMPKAQLCVVPGAGHGVLPLEAVQKFLA